MASKPLTIRIADGGRLNTSSSLNEVGEADFVRVLNMRRLSPDRLGRTEGWILFKPNSGGLDTQADFDGTESVLRLAELVRPNGDKVIVGASRTKIKRFDTATGLWSDISGGLTFSASGKRWQASTINGYLLLNNSVNLPISFRVEDATVTPIYEMRQVGYSCVERLYAFNGFLKLANVTRIKADQLDAFMFGYANHTAGSTSAKAANFSVAISDHQTQYNVTTGASTITVTLPAAPAFDDKPFYIWIKKADAGVGTVVTSPTVADELVSLTAINDIALLWWTGTNWAAKVFAGGVIPAHDPYGIPPASITQRYRWSVANGEFGEPTKFAPAFSVLQAASSTTVVLPFTPTTWVAGVTRVAVINGGPDGDVLGGQEGYEDGVLVTAIGGFNPALNGVPITLEIATTAGIGYPRIVTATRWTDISTIVAEYRLEGDGGEIIGALPLGELEVLYGSGGAIYTGRYTGDAGSPFIYIIKPAPKDGLNVPIWGDSIADINGDYHLFPGVGGRFFQFDGVSYPTIHKQTDQAKELFFTGVKASDEVFCVTNPNTKSVWFCSPLRVFSFSLEFNEVTEIDAIVGAAAFVTKPATTDRWFLLSIGKTVFTYGLVTNAVTNIKTYLRNGVAPTAQLTSGLISARLQTDEKTLGAYTPILASPSGDVAVTVQLRSTYNPSAALTDLLVPVQALPTPTGENFFTTSFCAIYFQDELVLTDERDLDFQVSARVFEFDRIGDARGVNRRVT